MKSPSIFQRSAFLRAPMAIALGSVTFAVGFLRLVWLSTRFTALMIRGENPAQALRRLEAERKADSLKANRPDEF